ncbi:MAG: cobaltochelatase subunit CobN [Crocinitomicaceae bacterium]|nr:cobaltochelatase subunit CobN [Crocinitomicaceae bacterium]
MFRKRFFRLSVILVLITIGISSCNKKESTGKKIIYPDSKILFIGLWDRAYPLLEKISEDSGIHLDQYQINDNMSSENLEKHYSEISFEKYSLVLILQINEIEGRILNRILEEAKQKRPELNVVEVDYRGSHTELLNSGVMSVDRVLNRYWLNTSEENLKRMLEYCNVKYAGGKGEIQPPVEISSFGIYHPDSKDFFPDWDSYRAWYKKQKNYTPDAPFVAMIVEVNYIVFHDGRVYDAVIREMEKNQINVVSVFGDADHLQSLIRAAKPSLMMLQHHSGPERTPEEDQTLESRARLDFRTVNEKNEKKSAFLEEMGIPYLFCGGLLGRVTIEQWENDVRAGSWNNYSGLARHEYYGIIEPHIVGAQSVSEQGYIYNKPIQERVERFAQRVKNWLRLQTLPNKDKKVALVYFHKYLGKADIGRPGEEMNRYINVPKSIYQSLNILQQQGYSVGSLPPTEKDLENLLREKGRNIPEWLGNEMDNFVKSASPILIPIEKYREWFNTKVSEKSRKEVIDLHGEIPGKLSIYKKDGKEYILLPAIQMGNIILAPQPDIGIKQFKQVMQSRKVPPSHNFLAFYFWLQEEFKADALVHYGAFGDEVFLPGKEIFLSKDDYPDIVIGTMPHIYIWPIENIGIGIIAKRRTNAVLLDHFVGPPLPTEFSTELSNLESQIYQFTQIRSDNILKAEYRKTITEEALQQRLPEKIGIIIEKNNLLSDENIAGLQRFIAYAKTQNSPNAMHIFGQNVPDERSIPLIAFMLQQNTQFIEKLQDFGIAGKDLMDAAKSDKVIRLIEYLLQSKYSDDEISKILGKNITVVKSALKEEIPLAELWWKNLQNVGRTEEDNFIGVLNGKYVSPGPGGTSLTNPDVLPTGRNMYGVSLKEIPSKQAWKVAVALLDSTLENYRREHGDFPKRVAFSETGMETFTDMGVMEAEVFYLIGIRPIWNAGGKITGLEVIPRNELNHPRIDPFISINGIFLKDFPYLVNLMDEAVSMAIAIDEPDNNLRITYNEIQNGLLSNGATEEEAKKLAGVRIFGTKAGEGGGRLFMLLPRSGTWDNREDILKVWNTMRTHTYGKDSWGDKNQELYNLAIQERELVISTWGNNLYGPLTNHHYPEQTGGLAMAIKMTGGKTPDVIIQDIRNKKLPGVVTLKEELNAELLATALNKTWIEGQMKEGYIGGTQLMQVPDNLFQWEAVNEGLISEAVWEQLSEVYLDDTLHLNMQEWFDENNPYAFQQLLSPMLESVRKGYWHPSEERLQQMVEAYASSVVRFGYNGGLYTGGNEKFDQHIQDQLNKLGKKDLLYDYNKMMAAGAVKGQKMQQEKPPEKKFPVIPFTSIVLSLVLAVLFFYGYRKRTGSPRKEKNKN